MKKFNYDKVKKIAIDKPDHQQIYVCDHHVDEMMNLLNEMGFILWHDSSPEELYRYPFAVNTKKKEYYIINGASVMACAVTCGAKVLKYQQMLELIDEDE